MRTLKRFVLGILIGVFCAGNIMAVQADELESLIQKLKSEDISVRKETTAALGRIGDSRAVEPLITALQDENPWVRSNAAHALGQIKDLRAIEPLIALLKDGNPGVREKVAGALAEIGDACVFKSFIDSFKKDEGMGIWRATIEEMERTGNAHAAHSFIIAKDDKNLITRWETAEEAGKIKNRQAIEPLFTALGDKNRGLQHNAAHVLLRIEGGKECLIANLKDKDVIIRRNAVRGLREMLTLKTYDVEKTHKFKHSEDMGIVESLIDTMKDKDPEVRWTVVEAAGYIRDARAVNPLISALKDENPKVRSSAVHALGNTTNTFKKLQAVEPLITALKDENPDVRMAAVVELERIRDARAVEPLKDAMKDNDPRVSEIATALMEGKVYLGGEPKFKKIPAVEPLIVALKDEDLSARAKAAHALGEIGDARAVEPLIEVLKDNSDIVQDSAALALSTITGKDFGEEQVKWQEWWEQNKENVRNSR